MIEEGSSRTLEVKCVRRWSEEQREHVDHGTRDPRLAKDCSGLTKRV